jgi:hypothetical protein
MEITRHMCVQLQSLSHAQVLKDYNLFRAEIYFSEDPFITKHPPPTKPWGEGAWRLGYNLLVLIFLFPIFFAW